MGHPSRGRQEIDTSQSGEHWTPSLLSMPVSVKKCPYCESVTIHPSRSGNRWLPTIVRLCIVKMRCHCCYRTFFHRGRALGGEPDNRRWECPTGRDL